MSAFHPALPSKTTGQYNSPESGFPCMMSTKGPSLGRLIHAMRRTVTNERRLFFVDGRVVMCCLNWIRDHVHMMKAFMHWEHDLISFYQYILDNQSDEGWFYEMLKQIDDPHWSFVRPKFMRQYPEDNLAATRLELEADIEYLMVEGAMQIYRVTGDDDWMRACLPKLEKGIEYMTGDPDRWDAAHGLCKRPFTIDTWDFTYGKPGNNRRIEPDTPMSIMHGDNSGAYQAMRQLAWLRRRFGDGEAAEAWEKRAEAIRENMFRYLWNGRFFIHQLHLNHGGADDREAERLSLSNPYDINRGVTDLAQSRAVIGEYMARRETSGTFAEWFSIEPPYEPAFSGHAVGRYVNGGISPFTAGELAKAAFNNGMEDYGWDIVRRLMAMAERDGTIYFLYDREGGTRELGGGPSGWGAAAILSAVDEGLAGIVDEDVQYRRMGFSPRWVVTEHDELRYTTGYELGKVKIDVYMKREADALSYRLDTPSEHIDCRIMLPAGTACRRVTVNGEAVGFRNEMVGDSAYAAFTLDAPAMTRDRFGWARGHVFDIRCEW